MYNNLLAFFVIYEARYKEYHHQKLALESSNFCHTPAYLATLLHLNNAKDVKELVAYTKKMLQRFLRCEFHHCVEEKCFDFQCHFQ